MKYVKVEPKSLLKVVVIVVIWLIIIFSPLFFGFDPNKNLAWRILAVVSSIVTFVALFWIKIRNIKK